MRALFLARLSPAIISTTVREIKKPAGLIEGEIGADTKRSVVFLAAHLGLLNAAATSGPFSPIHDLVELNGVGGAHDKELVPPLRARTPVAHPPRAQEADLRVSPSVCVRARALHQESNLATNRSIQIRRHSAGLVLSLVNGFQPKYQHSSRPRLTRPYRRLSSTMPRLFADRLRLFCRTRGS